MPQPAYGPNSIAIIHFSISVAVRIDAKSLVAIQKPEQESHQHVCLQSASN
jgi:hypothetical protein